jgi:hypothetical protein
MNPRQEFLSEEDLDLANLSWDELVAVWNQWLVQAQTTNEEDEFLYEHGVFRSEPACRAVHPRPGDHAENHG